MQAPASMKAAGKKQIGRRDPDRNASGHARWNQDNQNAHQTHDLTLDRRWDQGTTMPDRRIASKVR